MSRLENFGGNAASIWLEQLDPSLENCELKSTMNTKIKGKWFFINLIK